MRAYPTKTIYPYQTFKPNERLIKKDSKQEQQQIRTPISQIFKQKQATVWKSLQDKIQIEEGTIVNEIAYHFTADLNFRAYEQPTQIYPSFNNSFIVFFDGNSRRGSKIVHYSSEGKVIKLIYFQHGQLDVQMISEKHVLIFIKNQGRKEHRIEQWDIEKHERVSIPYLQVFDAQIKLMVFPKTQLFCLCEFSSSRWKPRIELALTYYRYPVKGKEDTFIAQVSRTFKKQQDDAEILMEKLNQQSMVGFINSNLKGEKYTRFCTYSLGKQDKIEERIHKFPNNFHEYADICLTKIVNLWEIQQGKFLINLLTEIDLDKINYEEEQEKYDEQKVKEIQRNHIFMWNCQKKTYRKMNLDIDEDSVIQVVQCFKDHNRNQIRRANLHQRYLRENFRIVPNRQVRVLSVKYVDVINEKIAVDVTPITQDRASTKPQKSYPAYLPNYEVQSFVSCKGSVNIWIRRVKCLKFPPAEIAIFLMQEFMEVTQQKEEADNKVQREEWDEDLLFYMCEILNDKQKATSTYKIGSSILKDILEKEEKWL